ncbi:MAG: ATP-binding protein, partial [Acidimicrobiales bacterium]
MPQAMIAVDWDQWDAAAAAGGSLDHDQVGRDTCPMGHRLSCPAFVGRDEELDVLDETLDVVIAGRAATVLVGGDAGIGKTRLVEELCERARSRGSLAATGVCVPADGGLPYAPIVGILRDVARQSGEPDAGVLGPLVSGSGLAAPLDGLVGRADVYSTMPRLADQLAKTRLFESILAGFIDLAERSPVVLVVEDLQWADSASAELLDFLTRNLADTRVLLVGTYRSEDLGRDHPLRPWLNELGRHPRVVQLRLAGLDRDEMAELIGGIVGHQPDWALLDAVWARSQGNPFFAEELTAARHAPSLSEELQGVIMARVDGLSGEAQRLLQMTAAAGATADHRLLATIGTLDAEALDRALAETVDRQVLVVDPTGIGYRFRHALLREAVYAALLPGERTRLHRLMAIALTSDASLGPAEPGHRAAELALHWWAAGEWAEALEPSIAAAEAAVAVLAFPEALVHLEHALAALDRVPAAVVPPGTDRLRLLEQAADAAYLAGDGQRSVDLARAAIERVDADADPATAARFHTLLGRNAWAIGDSDAAFEGYRTAAALLPADPPSVELARVLAEDARGLMLMSRFRDAERRCHEAIAVARAVGDRTVEGHARNTLGCCRSGLGHTDEGIELMREAL